MGVCVCVCVCMCACVWQRFLYLQVMRFHMLPAESIVKRAKCFMANEKHKATSVYLCVWVYMRMCTLQQIHLLQVEQNIILSNSFE